MPARRLVVAALAALAAVVVAGAAVLSADERDSGAATAVEPQPRAGLPAARALARASATTPRRASSGARPSSTRRAAGTRRAGSSRRYDSLEAKLGAAFAAWPASEDRIEQLGALYPRSALVQLHVGLARFWAGTGGALTAWREARDVEPDTPYAVRADDLIHPELRARPADLHAELPLLDRRRHAGDAARRRCAPTDSLRGRLLYGVALQRLGRPVSARRAFAEALRLAPNDVDALVADAVGRYEKSDPTAAFSRLGPLTRRFPQAATVRFHLGVLLLWQRDVKEAKRQLRLAQREPSREAGSRARLDGTSPSSRKWGPAEPKDGPNGLCGCDARSGKLSQLCKESVAN